MAAARGKSDGKRVAPSTHVKVETPLAREMSEARSKLVLILVISFLFCAGEFVGGAISHSLAILADAAHLLVDVFGFALSLFFLWLGQGKPKAHLSFGLKRAEVLGAMLSMFLIWLIAGVICYEAVVRIQAIVDNDPGYQPVTGWLMFTMALVGVLCNFIIIVVIGTEDVGGMHGHSHGSGGHGHVHGAEEHGHGHDHDHDEHGASETVAVQGALLNGTLAIMDTPAGERMRFESRNGPLPKVKGGKLTVVINRPGGRVEMLNMVANGDSGVYWSKQAPAEPHEFVALLRWVGADSIGEEFRFEMSEPEGLGPHGHGHSHGGGHGHAHGAPDPVNVHGMILKGRVDIFDTDLGERMRFVPFYALTEGVLCVDISRPNDQVETLELELQGDGSFVSREAPQEPHEFTAILRWKHGDEGDSVGFDIKEPFDVDSEHKQPSAASNHTKSKRNINVSSAFAHAIGHMAQDFGVVIAGALIWAYPYSSIPLMQLADPIASFLFTLIGLYPTFGVIRVSIRILMEGIPDGIEPFLIAQKLSGIPGVKEVHDLHIWGLTIDHVYLSVHLTLYDEASIRNILDEAHRMLQRNNVHHSTIQTEFESTVRHHDLNGIKCQNYEQAGRVRVPIGVELL